ncbi:adaptor [Staphylococcus phage S-CoN_Ph35]|nr:adaptor [Staphylococcus phage S-CoN_Ph35]
MFMQKMLYFDDDVKQIVDRVFFKGFMFNDERIDRYFKESFTLRFL